MTTKKFLIPSTPWRPFPRKAAILRGGHAFSGREASLRVEIETFCGHRFRVGAFCGTRALSVRMAGERQRPVPQWNLSYVGAGRRNGSGKGAGFFSFQMGISRVYGSSWRAFSGAVLLHAAAPRVHHCSAVGRHFHGRGGRRLKGEKEGFHEQEGEWSRRRGNGIENEKPCSLPFFGMHAAGGGAGSTVKFCVKGA